MTRAQERPKICVWTKNVGLEAVVWRSKVKLDPREESEVSDIFSFPFPSSHCLVFSKSGQCEAIPACFHLIEPKVPAGVLGVIWLYFLLGKPFPQALTHQKSSLQVWSRASGFVAALQWETTWDSSEPVSCALQKPLQSCISCFSFQQWR